MYICLLIVFMNVQLVIACFSSCNPIMMEITAYLRCVHTISEDMGHLSLLSFMMM